MTESVTQHYQWTKPEVTKSASTWGGFLNTDLDSIDSLVFANQQGIVPIGAIQMFGGAAAPANWLVCDGRSLDTTAYAALFAVLQYVHGGSGANFNLPNLTSKFPLGANPSNSPVGQVGGNYSVPIGVGNLPSHTHPIDNTTTHSHGITDPQHFHNINDPGHVHTGSATHAHGSNLMRFLGGSGQPIGVSTSPNNVTYGNTDSATSTLSIDLGASNVTIKTQLTGITGTNAAAANLTATQATGSGTPLTVIPAYVALSFIIRYQ